MPPKLSTSKRSTPPSSAFQFVNISSPSEIKQPVTQNLIRRSVAIHRREQQALRHSAIPGQENALHSCTGLDSGSLSAPNFCQVCGYSLRKKRDSRSGVVEGSEEIHEARVETACIEAVVLGATATDPFGTYPVPVQPYMHILLDHYVKDYCPNLVPFGKRGAQNNPIAQKFFQLLIGHEEFYHATLCIAATNLGLLSGQSIFKAIAYYHRGEAIKLLNKILREGNGEVTEQMISAVGSLAHHDVLIGDKLAVENHRNGIMAMIRTRGESPVSKLDEYCRRFNIFRAHWIDNTIASYSHTMPLLTPENPSIPPSTSRQVVPLATTCFASILDSPHFSPSIIEVVQDIVSFTCDIRSWDGVQPPDDEMVTFTARRSWIEWRLASLGRSHNSQQETDKMSGLENCVRLTLMIYMNFVVRMMPSSSALLLYLSKELKASMDTVDLEPLWGDYIELFTWVLFHGGAAATEAETMNWYVEQLVDLCKILKIWSFEGAIEFLSGFLWVRSNLAHRIKCVWYETVVGLSTFEMVDKANL